MLWIFLLQTDVKMMTCEFICGIRSRRSRSRQGTDVQTCDVLKTSSFSCWWFCDSITAVKRLLSNKVKPYGFTINETFYLSSAMFKFDWYHSYYSWQQTFEMKMCTYKQYSAVCFHLHWSGSRALIIHN